MPSLAPPATLHRRCTGFIEVTDLSARPHRVSQSFLPPAHRNGCQNPLSLLTLQLGSKQIVQEVKPSLKSQEKDFFWIYKFEQMEHFCWAAPWIFGVDVLLCRSSGVWTGGSITVIRNPPSTTLPEKRNGVITKMSQLNPTFYFYWGKKKQK